MAKGPATPHGIRPGRGPGGAGARLPLLLAVLGPLLAALPARANLRAPLVIPASPSAALSAPAAGLTVAGESLAFRCDGEACRVTAVYEVDAAAPAEVRLEFILPVEGPVTAATGGRNARVEVVPAEPLRPGEAKALRPAEPRAPALFRAGFTGALEAGRNRLTVSYTQPLGATEQDYGYGRSGRFVHHFRYELWPLREWTRSPGFRLGLLVTIERPAPGFLARWLGKARSVACLASDAPAPFPSARLEQAGDELRYQVEIGPAFPDRVTCFLGDEDLLPRP